MDRVKNKSELRVSKASRKDFFCKPRSPFVVVLDNLKVAYNVGTIFRLCDALMIEKVFLCGTTIIPPNGKIKSASRGAERWVPWEYFKSSQDAVASLKRDGYFIVAVELTKSSVSYDQVSWPNKPIAVILGREYDGVSSDLLGMADCIVDLPIYGMANSISVSVAAGVILYHLEHIKCSREGVSHQ